MVLSAQLAKSNVDPLGVSDQHLDQLAELSVRAALALGAAVPRIEAEIAAKEKAAEEAAEAAAAAEKEAADAAKAADKAAKKKA